MTSETTPTQLETLAQLIRAADGRHTLGAAALSEKLIQGGAYLPEVNPGAQLETLAQLIRTVDGRHDLGAAALSERMFSAGVRLQSLG